MNVALIGASGRVGSRLAGELLARGHTVSGIARASGDMAPRAGLTFERGDANDAAALAPLLTGHDAVISATRFQTTDPQALIDAVRRSRVPRFLVVGGAGSLEIAPGEALADSPGFPIAYKPEAEAGRAFLDALRRTSDLDWTFLSPSAEFAPGERTGTFRIGGDALLHDAHGKSWISMEDFAIALVDELERSEHSRQRFTVGY